jgi:hypothetical protein
MSLKHCSSSSSSITSKKIRKKIKRIKKDINDNATSYNRSIFMNNNYNKWTWEYIKVLIVFIVFLSGILFFYKLQFFIIAYSLFGILVLVLLFMFSNLNRHDSVNFDEINQNTYKMMSNESVNKYNTTILQNVDKVTKEPVAYCTGSSCCDTGTTWDIVKSKCVG